MWFPLTRQHGGLEDCCIIHHDSGHNWCGMHYDNGALAPLLLIPKCIVCGDGCHIHNFRCGRRRSYGATSGLKLDWLCQPACGHIPNTYWPWEHMPEDSSEVVCSWLEQSEPQVWGLGNQRTETMSTDNALVQQGEQPNLRCVFFKWYLSCSVICPGYHLRLQRGGAKRLQLSITPIKHSSFHHILQISLNFCSYYQPGFCPFRLGILEHVLPPLQKPQNW